MTICGSDECSRAASRERSARYRARKRDEVAQAETPAEVNSDGSYLSPWGVRYDSEPDAWGDCLLTGGLEGNRKRPQQEAWLKLLDAE
jgi:hypothetical protein